MCDIAVDAALKVARDVGGVKEVDIKRYAKVEKIPGGELEECCVMDGGASGHVFSGLQRFVFA
jgi:T-complex protein 1 subunit gamma